MIPTSNLKYLHRLRCSCFGEIGLVQISVDVPFTGYTHTVTVVTVCELVFGTTVEVALAVVVPGVGVIVSTGAPGVVGAFSPDKVRVHVIFVVLLVTVV